MHPRTRMRTKNQKLKTVLPVMDCPRVLERSASADLKRTGSGDEIGRNAMLRHAQARAKKEIYSHEGMVSVALTLLRFNSLGWSVTPPFLG